MSAISLDIRLNKGGGATGAWITIDGADVPITSGRGTSVVDSAKPHHGYVVYVEGPFGATATFQIEQKIQGVPAVLAKGKPTVSWGNTHAVEYDVFKLR